MLVFLLSAILRVAVSRADFYPFGSAEGDTVLPDNDDGSSDPIDLQFGSFPYFDEDETRLFVCFIYCIQSLFCACACMLLQT